MLKLLNSNIKLLQIVNNPSTKILKFTQFKNKTTKNCKTKHNQKI